jgi:hypothetical protein
VSFSIEGAAIRIALILSSRNCLEFRPACTGKSLPDQRAKFENGFQRSLRAQAQSVPGARRAHLWR